MLSLEVNEALAKWPDMSQIVFVPHNEEQYERLTQILDQLIDKVGEDEMHPLASLMELIAVVIKNYEDENVPEIAE